MKRTPLKRKTPMRRAIRQAGTFPAATIRKAIELLHASKAKPRKPLPKVSKKRAIENRAYAKACREWRAGHDGRCEMRKSFNGTSWQPAKRGGCNLRCGRSAMPQPHHSKGRGPFLCDQSTFIALCFDCHRWTDTHRRQAVALGYFTYVNPTTSNP